MTARGKNRYSSPDSRVTLPDIVQILVMNHLESYRYFLSSQFPESWGRHPKKIDACPVVEEVFHLEPFRNDETLSRELALEVLYFGSALQLSAKLNRRVPET